MLKKEIRDHSAPGIDNRKRQFKALLRYIHHLAKHKLGYPVSLLTYIGKLNNKPLGIKPGSLADVLLNNVGDPFKDSETSLMEVKRHERMLIRILENFFGLSRDQARGYVTTGGTEGNFAGLWWSKRFLINSELDKLIETDDAIKQQTKEEQALFAALAKIPQNDHQLRAAQLQKIIDIRNTISNNKNVVQQLLTPTVFYTKGHTHYSIPKIAEILHLNIRPVAPNPDGSIDLNSFKKELILNLGAHPNSPVIVIANVGTTITGAIDDIPNIKKILEEIKPKPIYTIHIDGALTGFVMPILKPFGDIPNYFDALGVNTIAVSAHKYPGLSQPCGIILAKKDFFDKAFEKSERSIDYVGNILDVTITGSRSGLNVLMFYNALYTLGLHKNSDELKKIVEENLAMTKYLHAQLLKIYSPEQVTYLYHFNVSFPRPPQAFAKKYQLMLTGDRATICVLPNVTKTLIDTFIEDLKFNKETVMNIPKTEHSIRPLTTEHAKTATELFVKVFCDSEPTTKHLEISYQEYKPFAKAVVQKAIKDGLSNIILDNKNRAIALIIAEDMADIFAPKIEDYPKMQPIFDLLDELSKPFMAGKKFSKGKIAHLWIVALDPDYRGQGLSTELDMISIETLAKKGFDFAYAEFTNELSENVTHQLKMVDLCNKIEYDSFKTKQNKQPFKGLKGGAAAYVAAIRPNVDLKDLTKCYTTDIRL